MTKQNEELTANLIKLDELMATTDSDTQNQEPSEDRIKLNELEAALDNDPDSEKEEELLAEKWELINETDDSSIVTHFWEYEDDHAFSAVASRDSDDIDALVRWSVRKAERELIKSIKTAIDETCMTQELLDDLDKILAARIPN